MNRQTEIWRRQKTKRRRKRQGKAMAFALPLLALLFAGRALLFGDAKADKSNIAPRAMESPVAYISPEGAQDRSERKTNATQSTPRSVPGGDDWNLLLINPWNKLPDDYEVTLTQLKNGHAVDKRCYPDLQQMMDDCRAEGLQPLICSSYRSQDKQRKLFDNKVNNLIAQGYSRDAARKKAAESIAVPGTSEHQTGLAVDIVDESNQNLDESQEDTPVQQWIMKNSWRYGFILRYPPDKSDITGIIYEPWHYRYVGKEAAKEIHEQGVCLEEYLAG